MRDGDGTVSLGRKQIITYAYHLGHRAWPRDAEPGPVMEARAAKCQIMGRSSKAELSEKRMAYVVRKGASASEMYKSELGDHLLEMPGVKADVCQNFFSS